MPAPILAAAIPAVAAGIGSIIGGERANAANRREARKNRAFQERMRNTQWQAAVSDMEAAGLNPALAYSQGPNASPGGSQAQQMDTLSPGISSAMQAKRIQAELGQIRAATEAQRASAQKSRAEATTTEANLAAYGISKTPSGSLRFMTDPGKLPLLTRQLQANVGLLEENVRKTGLTSDIMEPMALLMQKMGIAGPIAGLLSTLLPGGKLKAAGKILRRK